MSMDSPRISEAITEHSMCQPGRPRPQGDSQLGSPGFEFFQTAKSFSDRFSPSPVVVRSPSPSFSADCENKGTFFFPSLLESDF